MLMIKNSNLKSDVEYVIVAFAWVLKFVGSKRIVGCWDRIAKRGYPAKRALSALRKHGG